MNHCVSYHQVSCVITIGRIEQVAGVRSSSVRVRVDVVVHNLEFYICKSSINNSELKSESGFTSFAMASQPFERFKLRADVVPNHLKNFASP